MAEIQHLAMCTKNNRRLARFYHLIFGLEEVWNAFQNSPYAFYMSDGYLNLNCLQIRAGSSYNRMVDGKEIAKLCADYVVIDTCSMREAVDPLYLAQRADATVLSVRAFQSSTAAVERACERLTQLGTPLLGAVLADPSGAATEL